jgi:hypothetical protein
MAFKVIYKGAVEIQCENADEAIQIAQRLTDTNGHYASPAAIVNAAAGGLEVSRYRELVGFLNTKQKRFLAMLVENQHGRTYTHICQQLELEDNKALGGMLSGISKFAKKVGVNTDSMWISERKKVGNETIKEFRSQPEFRKIAAEIGLTR